VSQRAASARPRRLAVAIKLICLGLEDMVLRRFRTERQVRPGRKELALAEADAEVDASDED